MGVLVTLSFGQLMPELLAQEYPLRFMNMIMAYSVGYISLFFDAVGVGHGAWTVYFLTRGLLCGRYEAKEEPNVKMNSGDGLERNTTATEFTDAA